MSNPSIYIIESLNRSIKCSKEYLNELQLPVSIITTTVSSFLGHPTNLFCLPRSHAYRTDREAEVRVGTVRITHALAFVLAYLLNCRKFIFRSIIGTTVDFEIEKSILISEIDRIMEIWAAYYTNYLQPNCLQLEHQYICSMEDIVGISDLQFDFVESMVPIYDFLIAHEVGHVMHSLFYSIDTWKSDVWKSMHPLTRDSTLKLRKKVDEIGIHFSNEFPVLESKRQNWLEELFCDIFSFQTCSRFKYFTFGLPGLVWQFYGAAVVFYAVELYNLYIFKETGAPGLAESDTHPSCQLRFASLNKFFDIINSGKHPVGYELTKTYTSRAALAVEQLCSLMYKE